MLFDTRFFAALLTKILIFLNNSGNFRSQSECVGASCWKFSVCILFCSITQVAVIVVSSVCGQRTNEMRQRANYVVDSMKKNYGRIFFD